VVNYILLFPGTGVCGQETSEHYWVGFFKPLGTVRQKSLCTMRFGVRGRRRFSRANAGFTVALYMRGPGMGIGLEGIMVSGGDV
jgi:hypothetical protein